MLKWIAVFFVLCVSGVLAAQTPADSIQKKSTPPNIPMRTYYMVFLKKGPNWTPEKTEESTKIQAGHMAHIQKMADSGKLLLAGPFMDNQEIRGIFVFKVDTIEEAKSLTDEDPAVKAGRLIMEIHPWYSAKGINIDPSKD